MKEFSQETIDIGNEAYILFLNRKGIIAWEKFCKEESEKAKKLDEKYKGLVLDSNDITINDNTNPFEGLEEIDDIEEDQKTVSTIYRKLYWIMLYTNHQFNMTKVNELYDKAIEEYGEPQLIALGQQMMDEANSNLVEKQDLKNLAALKPKKN